MGQINTNNYPTVNSLADADLLIVENAQNGTGTTTPKQLRENAIGTDTLQTSAQTVTGAINELKHEIDLGAGVARYDVNTITSGYLGQFSGSANLLLLHLTTDGTADATNGYMMMLSYSRPVARFAYGRLVDADGVAYKQDVYADNTIICKISNSGEGTESDPEQVVILGIINAGFMLTPTAVVSDRDIQDGQGNTLSVLAEALTKTASGNPVVITDCAGGKARSLKTTINAIQDLHGYDKPWVGGAGKNKFPNNTNPDNNSSGMSVEKLANGYKLTSVSTAQWQNCAWIIADASVYAGKNIFFNALGTYTGGTHLSRVRLEYDDVGGTQVLGVAGDLGTGCTLTVPAGATGVIKAQLYLSYGQDCAVGDSTTFYNIQFEEGSTATSFAPYSNICPISGRTAVAVDEVGKNLLKYPYRASSATDSGITYTHNSDGTISLSGTSTSAYSEDILFQRSSSPLSLKQGSYILSGGLDSNVRVTIGHTNPSTSAWEVLATSQGSDAPFTLATDDNAIGVTVSVNTNNYNANGKVIKPMIRDASITDATFVPYAHSSATISLGQTVYGADINWDTGVMTVKTALVTLTGASSEAWDLSGNNMRANTQAIKTLVKTPLNNDIIANIKSSAFVAMSANNTYRGTTGAGISVDTGGQLSVCDGKGGMTVAGWTAYLVENPLQVEYELATPIELTLTPTEVQMLKGYNRVTIESGSIELGYIAKLT